MITKKTVDNRNYEYEKGSISDRPEYEIISSMVKKGSSVIDLGSGDGSLLKLLQDVKKTKGVGIEISSSGVAAAKKKGVKSRVGRIDVKLPFRDKGFDYAICNVTLQMVMYPEVLLKEMKRISKKQIITFPNFAFILNRLDMLINGRMPGVMIPGYSWYTTGHIHQLSIKDFEDFCKANDYKIMDTKHIYSGSSYAFLRPFALNGYLLNINPNLFACMGVYLISNV
jgi:methionine biosynthesis protein MetW